MGITEIQVARDGRQFLQELVHYRTYAQTLPGGRKESRAETITRVMRMHQEKYPALAGEIEEAFRWVYSGHAIPSMRTMQFAGDPITRSNARAYNCAYAALTSWQDFGDLFWLLMNGVGTGFSVQDRHISQLPLVRETPNDFYAIPDNREGWADSVVYLLDNPAIEFDYSLIRARGEKLSTGGVASGPDSLRAMHEHLRRILTGAVGRRLTSLEAHDIMCHIADVVAVGGVRRAALISQFDYDDEEMLRAKHDEWWNDNPQRMRANNSAVLLREDPELEQKLRKVLDRCFESHCGEPGVILTNDLDYGFNPCLEISLRDGQLCNLTDINVAACETFEDFIGAARAAAVIGTLQASYTDFPYLQSKWSENCKKDALLGVSMTGQAQGWNTISDSDMLSEAARVVVQTNQEWAVKLGIEPAARTTTTKPSGNSSAWLGVTSGIHSAHSPYYLRRVRVDRKSDFGKYLLSFNEESEPNSGGFIETDKFSPENIVITVPVAMEGSVYREDERAIDLMERAKHVYENWISPGHVSGPNTHNVSLTVSYANEEWDGIVDWMVANVDSWSGISLLPYDGGNYEQAPFEEIDRIEYLAWLEKIPHVDFSLVSYEDDELARLGELACSGGQCEIQ